MDNQKIWEVLPVLSASADKELSAHSPLIRQLLYNRGLITAASAKRFFSSDWELSSEDPFAFRDMKAAVKLIIDHLKQANLIGIAGDYDADGITASAVLYKTIEAIRGRAEVWIPSRLGEGYGLSKHLIDQIADAGAKLLITVDNGVRARQEVAYAKSKGLDVIITDHHMKPDDTDDMPEALVIDPILPEETYPYKYLAGVGVAFKLVCGLLSASTLSEAQKGRLREAVLDLVAIGTIADCVSLTGENRSLVRQGLAEINKQLRPGTKALITAAAIKGRIEEWQIGWQIAPRLNVAGRLEHANSAFRLMITDDQAEADKLAKKLNEQNILRQVETARVVEYCQRIVEKDLKNDRVLVLVSPDLLEPETTEESANDSGKWLEGVIGLVAGRLCEKYGKPTLVICKSEGKIKGSGRSVEPIDIVALLGQAKEHLTRFGGHKMACGFTIKNKASLAAFSDKIKMLAADSVSDEALRQKLKIDAVLDLGSVDGNLADQLEKFSPFGQANPLPLFLSRGAVINDLLPLGSDGQHLKLRFGSLWAVAFNVLKKNKPLTLGQKVDIVYSVEWNEYNNYKNLQLKLVDWRASEAR